jgi:hypothetical protein
MPTNSYGANTSRDAIFTWVGIGLFFCIWILLLATGACDVQTSDMRRIMNQEGITSATFGGHAYGECGRDDNFSREFSGIKNGQSVAGSVCGGALKNFTVRFK